MAMLEAHLVYGRPIGGLPSGHSCLTTSLLIKL